jgi:serine/alanine adding enzyme
MILKINEAVDVSVWELLLKNNSYATPFQTQAFFQLYNNVPGSSAEIFTVEENKELLALCVIVFLKEKGLKGFFSRRAIIFGGPLIKKNASDVLFFLLDGITNVIKNRVIYIETRNFEDYAIFKSVYLNNGWKYIPYLNFRMNLSSKNTDNILAEMPYNRRREIRQTLNEGVVYHECKNRDEIVELYTILHELYKTRVHLPIPELDFFMQLFQNEAGKVFIVKHNEKIIGGSFCIFLNHHSIYTMYYCGIRNYHPKIFPTHIAIWAAVEYAIYNKIEILDFMGAGQPGNEYGVRDYKAKFGGELVEYGRFVKINNFPLYQLGKLGLKISSKIKK